MKIKNNIPLILLLLLGTTNSFAQQEKDTSYISGDYIVFKGDTLLIELEEVKILNKPKFKTNYDKRYYYWLRKKTLKAYPYAKLASERLDTLQNRLAKIKSKRQKKRYTKRIQKYLEGEFTDQLKKLTRTEGRILIKLIHRQTGDTTFNLVRNLRSGWNAFWYNTTANLFKLSLKSEYNPAGNNEDYMIEDILQRSFLSGDLDYQDSKLDIDFFSLKPRIITISE